mmetsp:Transcript_15090/g.50084  ORF Transcript_15090/g.50084 Transcript_15090/m.50084 type:complete len:691 (+) Transcript_15090:876-2948(+)|eukprot:CAMPEP_0202754020 /NCGR_PEP_ID=MMETSP1388-20130828/14010_1 /ASSEMBLY_ACC=CAM_ASM_000864 /TAXON_ID=37098 /ORGANISM="Isochrysis sp, Strain CCMP1244" /LENGTH=690 /DNA_ID=CAMNT_0049421793 /DNA_START=157 /DNA_END=2229 /DNA_ORIENTATION=+
MPLWAVDDSLAAQLTRNARQIVQLLKDIQVDIVRHVRTALSLKITVVGVSVDGLMALLGATVIVVVLCRWQGTSRMLRWPILLLILTNIVADLVGYLAVRCTIKLVEWLLARATSWEAQVPLEPGEGYAEWLAKAEALDASDGRAAWRARLESELYDWRHAQATAQRLRQAREEGDAAALMRLLLPCLKPNVAGVQEYELYCRARAGTKHAISALIEEVSTSLRWIADTRPTSPDTTAFLRTAHVAFGNEALVLSGGATLGIYHYGVLKALLSEGLLPAVISGTSAGAVVAAMACCRTDDELQRVLEDESDLFREMGSEGPFADSEGRADTVGRQLWRLLRHGRMYDAEQFRCGLAWFTRGFTFREAYGHSGRTLNITCTPLKSRGNGAPPLMLNHIDTPHIDIASAVTASACVPGLIEPVVLLERGPDGALRPFHHLDASDDRITLRDGSFESDVPLKQLLGAFGCCFTIVSQVNPHIACFYAHPCGRPGRPSAGRDRTGAWRGGFLLSAIEVAIKEDLRRHLRTIQRLRLMSDLTGFDLTQMWLQEQDGSVTLTPAIQLGDLTALISNLEEPAQLSRRIREMERATFEASALLRTRFDVRAALDECIAAAGLRAAASDRWLHDARSAHTPPSSQQRRERPGGEEEEPEARARPPAADDGSALAAGLGGGPHRRRAARSPTPRRGRLDA